MASQQVEAMAYRLPQKSTYPHLEWLIPTQNNNHQYRRHSHLNPLQPHPLHKKKIKSQEILMPTTPHGTYPTMSTEEYITNIITGCLPICR